MAFLREKRIFLALIGLPILLLILAIIPLEKNYVFISNDSNKVAAYLPLSEAFFQIKYTHTIHGSDVLESYKVLEDGSLLATELEYEDFNIGMPSNAEDGEVFTKKDGKYQITNMARKMVNFRLFVGDVDAGLAFLTDNEEFDLKKVLQRGKSYTLKVKRLSIIQQLRGVELDEQESAA